MQKQKLTVTNELGTFTRTTHRVYTHVLVVGKIDENGNLDAGTLAWSSRLDLGLKQFNHWAWMVTSETSEFRYQTIALCALDGTIVKRLDRAPAVVGA
jgi:hypothetical protein